MPKPPVPAAVVVPAPTWRPLGAYSTTCEAAGAVTLIEHGSKQWALDTTKVNDFVEDVLLKVEGGVTVVGGGLVAGGSVVGGGGGFVAAGRALVAGGGTVDARTMAVVATVGVDDVTTAMVDDVEVKVEVGVDVDAVMLGVGARVPVTLDALAAVGERSGSACSASRCWSHANDAAAVATAIDATSRRCRWAGRSPRTGRMTPACVRACSARSANGRCPGTGAVGAAGRSAVVVVESLASCQQRSQNGPIILRRSGFHSACRAARRQRRSPRPNRRERDPQQRSISLERSVAGGRA